MTYYTNLGDYALLGFTCNTNMNVLTSNAKFINPNDNIYNLHYTKTRQDPVDSINSSNQNTPNDDDIKQINTKKYKKCCTK
jgi:hypothetical protein